MRNRFPHLPESPSKESGFKYFDWRRAKTNDIPAWMELNKPCNSQELQHLRVAIAKTTTSGGYECRRITYEWEGQERLRYEVRGPSAIRLLINVNAITDLMDLVNEVERSGSYRNDKPTKGVFADEDD